MSLSSTVIRSRGTVTFSSLLVIKVCLFNERGGMKVGTEAVRLVNSVNQRSPEDSSFYLELIEYLGIDTFYGYRSLPMLESVLLIGKVRLVKLILGGFILRRGERCP